MCSTAWLVRLAVLLAVTVAVMVNLAVMRKLTGMKGDHAWKTLMTGQISLSCCARTLQLPSRCDSLLLTRWLLGCQVTCAAEPQAWTQYEQRKNSSSCASDSLMD